MAKKDKDLKEIKIPVLLPGDILATDTMRCKSCNAIIGCFAGPPIICPVCGKSPHGDGWSLSKLIKRKRRL